MHNAFDHVAVQQAGIGSVLWRLLHAPGLFSSGPFTAVVAYPLIPWFGVMAIRYSFGKVITKHREKSVTLAWRSASAMLAVFLLVRWCNCYGDPLPWTAQPTPRRILLAFLNVEKYPPSLLFLLLTLAITLFLFSGIRWAEEKHALSSIRSIFQVFGRVPFFYFLLHIAVIHLFALIISFVRGKTGDGGLQSFRTVALLQVIPPDTGMAC
jgi:uncharacterized membrane protein